MKISNEYFPDEVAIFRDANSDDIIYWDPKSPNIELNKPGAFWIPAVGLSDWDGHVYISGATGSGKSYLINKILEKDNLKKKRERIMFTDLKNRDESIPEAYKKFGDYGVDNQYVSSHIDKNMFIFDDSTDPDILKFRNHMLEKARHRKATVIAVNHRLRDGTRTKELMNESRYVVTFPSSNRGAVGSYMKDYMQMRPRAIEDAIQRTISEGRHLVFHLNHPNALASKETAWLI